MTAKPRKTEMSQLIDDDKRWKEDKPDMYEIILATEEDKEQVMSLYNAQMGREFCPWDEDYPSYETIDYDLGRDALFVIKEEDEIIAAISVEEDENVEALDCWDESIQPGGELARLAVAPYLQGRGIAKQMLSYGLEELKRRGFKSVHFLVNKYNVKAIKAYSGFGFNVVGECRMYDQDFLCYEKAF